MCVGRGGEAWDGHLKGFLLIHLWILSSELEMAAVAASGLIQKYPAREGGCKSQAAAWLSCFSFLRAQQEKNNISNF